MIERAFHDLDSAAYKGAAGVEKVSYQWLEYGEPVTWDHDEKDKPHPIGESEHYSSAMDAKLFMERLEMMEIPNLDCWERVKSISIGTEEDVKSTVKSAVEEYTKTAEKLTGNSKIIHKGFLTDTSEQKTKIMKGTERLYQYNRDPNNKPTHLAFARQFILDNYAWCKMSKPGWEADTHCVGLAEKYGTKAVILSYDKDLKQAENTHFIDLNIWDKRRELIKTTSLGDVYETKGTGGKTVIVGHGFKFLAFQAAVGDTSDGYHGLKGFGEKTGLNLFESCKTKEEVVRALLEHYEKKMKKGILDKAAKEAGIKPLPGHIKYLSWDGQKMKLNAKELLQQHFDLAYQERSLKDKFNLEEYL